MNRIVVTGRSVKPLQTMKDLTEEKGKSCFFCVGSLAVYGGKDTRGNPITHFFDFSGTWYSQEAIDSIQKGTYLIVSGEMVYTEKADKDNPTKKVRYWSIKADRVETVKERNQAPCEEQQPNTIQTNEFANPKHELEEDDDLPF